MRNPLQEQLLKAGLVKKGKVAEVVREQNRQRQGKAAPAAEALDVRELQNQRAERDRALAAERNAELHAAELRAQLRQLVDYHKVAREGDLAYRFDDGGSIKTIWVNATLRTQLAHGALLVVRHGDGYELVPRAAADKIRERDPAAVVLDHRPAGESASLDPDDAYYARFTVPDDLIW